MKNFKEASGSYNSQYLRVYLIFKSILILFMEFFCTWNRPGHIIHNPEEYIYF